MVAALVGLLVGHTGLLEQVDVNEATSKFAHVVEINSDELSEPDGVVIDKWEAIESWVSYLVSNIQQEENTWTSCRS